MIRENALGKKNSCHYVGLRYISRFLLPIVSVCCIQAWAEEIELVSAPGETKEVTESGTYTASQDLTFGALEVKAQNVTFDFSEDEARKVVFNGSSATALLVNKKRANVTFKRGEWSVAEGFNSLFLCSNKDAYETKVFLDSCVWTNLNSVYVGRNASSCTLTLDNHSRIYSKEFRLVNGGDGRCALNILGGSGLFLSSTDTPFRTDTRDGDGGNGTITVAGDGSILSAPNSEFRFGYYAADQFLVVSNKASLVANKFIIGVNSAATGSQVLVADSATLTAKDISIRNPGCVMTVSNATLAVDSTAVDAIKVGYAGRTGGSFVLSGKDAQINYNPSGNVDVFAADSGGAEFRIENGATWEVDATQIASKTSNSVFRVGYGGTFRARDNNRLQFGPAGDDNADPACSLSNRLEVCDGGKLEFASIRFSGAGNMLIVSNGLITCGSIQIGYNRPYWINTSKVTSRDCALVLRGESGQIDAQNGALQIQNGSVLRFEVPEDGYESDIIPLKVKSLSFADGTNMEIDCEAFMYKGGKVTLVEVTEEFKDIDNMIASVNASLPQGCHLSEIGKKLMLTCSKRRFVFSIR